jgi:hypothetical protein
VEIKNFVDPSSTAGACTHAQLGMFVIVPASGVTGDVRPYTTAGESRAWSPPV